LLSAVQVMLHHYSGHNDIFVGTCVANRNHLEKEPLIGLFANDIVLRTDLSGNPTLRELLVRARETALQAFVHQDLPILKLIEKCQPERNLTSNPLFQTMFVMQNAPLENLQFEGLTVGPFDLHAGTAEFDLTILVEKNEEYRVTFEYKTEVFEAATVRQMLDHYQTTLEAMVRDPAARIRDLPIRVVRTENGKGPLRTRREELAAPRDTLESQLLEIWESGFGKRPISARDDFFELGGDSLLAARLFAEIEKTFQIELPLATLLQAPTIEGLARIVRERGSSVSWSSLVAIQPGGTRPPLFLAHGAGGNVLIYRDLARYLGPDQPVYGLQSQGLDGKQPFLDRIEDMAARYVKEIRKAQPEGPYFLAGYCVGGTVALEMAQQLQAQEQEVALLALIDTLNWAEVTANSFLDQFHFNLQKIAFHWQNFWLLGLNDKLKFLRGKLKVLKSRSLVWFGMLLGKFVKEDQRERSDSQIFAELWDANERAAFDYVPRVYTGRIIQFRPVRQYTRYDGQERGWDRLASEGVEVYDLLVYPGGMLAEPFVGQLAAELEVCIVKVLRGKRRTGG
jgi:thioesterase domain-containing protein/acyl carrier protein